MIFITSYVAKTKDGMSYWRKFSLHDHDNYRSIHQCTCISIDIIVISNLEYVILCTYMYTGIIPMQLQM